MELGLENNNVEESRTFSSATLSQIVQMLVASNGNFDVLATTFARILAAKQHC